ncbi:small subunit of acetolactate synthase-domain-containing protein [Kockovaella imperatae]|uniref:Small subunit of acetolactate synthase-domain-containing protein n=1 Tax=Kockovaella imperatae TaxID=4999 RepID=A0A1Y1UIC2_9TREE|nr:small subunit of acetolactate synthase-domain-containing protein [Kockovaella imperatae]ORX37234.1 small subunit of acetolactate synthase-domain-containing protein [Kockovaella imperatae]
MSLRRALTGITPLKRGSSPLLSTSTRCASSTSSSSSANATGSSNPPKAPKSIDDSTSALDYKMHRPIRRMPHVTTPPPRAPSVEEAVTNILYNTPPPSTEPYKRHLLNCLVQNEPGVLSRVSGIIAARGFNIDSLVVCATEIRDLSRMCIVLKGQDGVVEQARRQLEDLVPVWAVLDYTQTPKIERELLLAKVSILGPEFAAAQLGSSPTGSDSQSFDAAIDHQDSAHPPSFVGQSSSGSESTSGGSGGAGGAGDKYEREQALARSFESSGSSPSLYPARQSGLSVSEALIAKNLHLGAIKTLTDQFGGKVVDVADSSCIVELTAKSSRVEAFLNLIRPFGLLEAARSGVMVLPRTPLARWGEEEEVAIERGEVDASMLPPG